MINEVYNKKILELAGNIPRIGRLSDADATATAHSKLCGSTVTIDLKMAGDEVTAVAGVPLSDETLARSSTPLTMPTSPRWWRGLASNPCAPRRRISATSPAQLIDVRTIVFSVA